MEDLKKRIVELEEELKAEKSKHEQAAARPRISQMSSEVVDSNPYRYTFLSCLHLPLSANYNLFKSTDGFETDGNC